MSLQDFNIAKLNAKCANSIGEEFRIRLDKRTVQTGIISECKPHGTRQRARSQIVIFEVMLECGANKTVKGPFYVERIPQA